MHKENLVAVLKGEKALTVFPAFLECVGASQVEMNIVKPKVEVYRNGEETLLVLEGQSGRSNSAIHVHFSDAAKKQRGIITLSATLPDKFCSTWRVGAGSKDEHFATTYGAWVDTGENIGFYLREGAQFQSKRNEEEVRSDRMKANRLLSIVKLEMQ